LELNQQLENISIKDTISETLTFELNDTIFVYRKITKEFYHAIYINKNRKTIEYKWLSDFSFDENELQTYKAYFKNYIEKQDGIYKKVNATELPKNWIPIYQYQNKFYLYGPSDWGNADKRIINDSSFVIWYMDGPVPIPLISVKQDSNKYLLEMKGYFNKVDKKQRLVIHQIDQKTKLSVFEFLDNSEKYRYQLYVPKESINHFDMIVNYCEHQKQLEFKFDEINFKALIKNSLSKSNE